MGYDIRQQVPGWRLPVEWKAPADWFPHITVLQDTRQPRRMGYGSLVKVKPVALLAEMPLTEVRGQRIVCLRGARNHKLY
jgi:hypothetical protein